MPLAPTPARASERPKPAEAQEGANNRPVLASELLADELAPVEPARRSCRTWLVLIAAGFAAVGMAMRLAWGVPEQRLGAATVSFVAGAAASALALLPFSYRGRATAALIGGSLLMSLGLRGLGPLGGLAYDGGEWRDLARLVTLSVLPPALALRSRYPTYRSGRWLVLAAIACAAPFVLLEFALLVSPGVDLQIRLLSAVTVGVVGASSGGLSRDGLTRCGAAWSWVVALVLPMEIGLRELTPLGGADTGLMTYPITAVAMLLAAGLTSLGTYQLVAHSVAPRARASLKSAQGGPGSARLNVVKG